MIASRHFFTFLLLCLTFLSQIAIAIPANKLPLNQTPIVDQAQILTESEHKTLNQQIRGWYKTGIAQVGVVTVSSTDGEDDFSFAMKIFERWQLGDKDKNNGLLLFINNSERKLRVITGYGLEAILPDISIKRIIDQDIIPEFKKNAYFTGIKKGLNAMIEQITADPEVRAQIIAADQARKDAQYQTEKVNEIFSPLIIIFNIILSLILRSISFLKPKNGLRFLISFFSVASITGFITIFLNVEIFLLIPPAIIAVIIGTAIANKGNKSQYSSNIYTFPRTRSGNSFSDFSFDRNNYEGGGGSSGGGGASGSW